MFDVLAAASGAAVAHGPALPDVSQYGSYPILQFFIGAVIVIGCLMLWFRGERERRPDPPAQSGPTQVFFDGPLNEMLKTGERIAQGIERLAGLMPDSMVAKKAAEETRQRLTKDIEDTRHTLRAEMQKENAEGETEMRELQERVRKAELEAAERTGETAELRRRIEAIESRPRPR